MSAPPLGLIARIEASNLADEDKKWLVQGLSKDVRRLSKDAERKRNERKAIRENTVRGQSADMHRIILREDKSKKTDSRCASADAEVDGWFQEIWEEYPKRKGANPKKPARERFKGLLKKGVKAEDIAKGVIDLRTECYQNQTDPRFIPQMITWLNQERWADGQPNRQAEEVLSTNGRGH